MKKYIITIINLETNTVHNLVRDNDNVDETIEKELGGWNNLKTASTSTKELDFENFQVAGITKDNKSMFSILCYVEKKEDK